MRSISREHLTRKAREYWQSGNTSVSKAFLHILGGEILDVISKQIKDNHQVFLIIIRNPKIEIENYQISLIADALGGCLTEGTIFYQGNYAYITWSNLSLL